MLKDLTERGLWSDDMKNQLIAHGGSIQVRITTVLPAKSDSDIMFCLHSYQGLIIDRSLVY